MSVLFCIVSLKKLKLDLSISILLLALHVSCTLQIPVGYIISSVRLLKEKENIPVERNFAAQKEIISREKAEKELISGHPQRLRVSFPGKRKQFHRFIYNYPLVIARRIKS